MKFINFRREREINYKHIPAFSLPLIRMAIEIVTDTRTTVKSLKPFIVTKVRGIGSSKRNWSSRYNYWKVKTVLGVL